MTHYLPRGNWTCYLSEKMQIEQNTIGNRNLGAVRQGEWEEPQALPWLVFLRRKARVGYLTAGEECHPLLPG
jgi:hypothetical protein